MKLFSGLHKYNLFFYLKKISNFLDVDKLRKLLTPVPSREYTQIYHLPEAVEITRERKIEILSSIIKNLADIDTDINQFSYDERRLKNKNNFFTNKFYIIFDLDKTRILNSVSREIFKDISNVIDLFPNIKLVIMFPNLDHLYRKHTLHFEYINDFYNELNENIKKFKIQGMVLEERYKERERIYYRV